MLNSKYWSKSKKSLIKLPQTKERILLLWKLKHIQDKNVAVENSKKQKRYAQVELAWTMVDHEELVINVDRKPALHLSQKHDVIYDADWAQNKDWRSFAHPLRREESRTAYQIAKQTYANAQWYEITLEVIE